MALIYIFNMILSADEIDAISPGHRGLYQWYDQAKINGLFEKKRMNMWWATELKPNSNIWFPLRGQSPSNVLWTLPQPYVENDVQETLGSRLKFHTSGNMTYFLHVPHLCSVSLTYGSVSLTCLL